MAGLSRRAFFRAAAALTAVVTAPALVAVARHFPPAVAPLGRKVGWKIMYKSARVSNDFLKRVQ